MRSLVALFLLCSAITAQNAQKQIQLADTDAPLTPVDSPGGGTYSSTQSVTITDATATFILYTLDGSTPACPGTGTLYTGAFNISATTTLKAIGCNGITGGSVLTSVYTISGGSPFTITGKTCVGTSNFGNPSCTWSGSPSIGDSIYCGVANFNGVGASDGHPMSVTDNASTPNTYTQDGATFNDGTSTQSIKAVFHSFSIAHAPTTTTMSVTGATQNGPWLSCFSATGGTPAFDVLSAGNTQPSGSPNTNTIVPTGAADLALCFGSVDATTPASVVFTAGSGFSLSGAASITSAVMQTRQSENAVLVASGSQSASISFAGGTPADSSFLCGAYK